MVDCNRFADALRRLWPHADPILVAGTIGAAPVVFPQYGLISNLTVAHAMAQFSVECGAGRHLAEDMNYSAARLLLVFPAHFTHEQAILYQHNPRQIADHAYGGRMGNAPPPSDDGWNFRGQGLSQLTGRDNYIALAKASEIDVVGHPEFLVSPDFALECAVADFVACGCLRWAESDNVLGVSSMLNLGHFSSDPNKINGYQERKAWLALWKHTMGVEP
jgi:putative chitinase